MKDVHIAVGVLAIALVAVAALYGAFCWWRARRTVLFWKLLRAGQVVIVVEVALGGALLALGRKTSGLHELYGILPLLVSFIAEQLRVSSAQMVLDARGIESPAAVGELEPGEQQAVVTAIVQRELGVMVLAAVVIVVLLARAAGTG